MEAWKRIRLPRLGFGIFSGAFQGCWNCVVGCIPKVSRVRPLWPQKSRILPPISRMLARHHQDDWITYLLNRLGNPNLNLYKNHDCIHGARGVDPIHNHWGPNVMIWCDLSFARCPELHVHHLWISITSNYNSILLVLLCFIWLPIDI